MASSSKYFSFDELKCKCGCERAEMDDNFMTRLDAMRWKYNHPITLNSAYRCPEHNKNEGGVDDSPHVRGLSVDARVSGEDAHRLLKIALDFDFQGIGVSQKGEHGKRFIHIDDSQGATRPWVWSY